MPSLAHDWMRLILSQLVLWITSRELLYSNGLTKDNVQKTINEVEEMKARSSAKSRRHNCVCTSFIEPELLSVRNWSKVFMKRLNRGALKLHPCRIPLLHANVSDSSWFTHILEGACAYRFCSMASILELRPTEANFSKSRSWCTLSKALEKSMKHA